MEELQKALPKSARASGLEESGLEEDPSAKKRAVVLLHKAVSVPPGRGHEKEFLSRLRSALSALEAAFHENAELQKEAQSLWSQIQLIEGAHHHRSQQWGEGSSQRRHQLTGPQWNRLLEQNATLVSEISLLSQLRADVVEFGRKWETRLRAGLEEAAQEFIFRKFGSRYRLEIRHEGMFFAAPREEYLGDKQWFSRLADKFHKRYPGQVVPALMGLLHGPAGRAWTDREIAFGLLAGRMLGQLESRKAFPELVRLWDRLPQVFGEAGLGNPRKVIQSDAEGAVAWALSQTWSPAAPDAERVMVLLADIAAGLRDGLLLRNNAILRSALLDRLKDAVRRKPEWGGILLEKLKRSRLYFEQDKLGGKNERTITFIELEMRRRIPGASSDARIQRILTGHAGGIQSMAFHPGGSVLVTSGYDRRVRFWRVAGGEEIPNPYSAYFKSQSGEENGLIIGAMAFSPDGKECVQGGVDNQVWLLKPSGRRKKEKISPTKRGSFAGPVLKVAFSPDGSTVAAASGSHTSKVYVWQGRKRKFSQFSLMPPGENRGGLNGESPWRVVRMDLHMGRRLAVYVNDMGSVRLAALSDPPGYQILRGADKSIILAVAFSPDGKRVAVALDDEKASVEIWSVDKKERLEVLHARAPVWSLAYSPSGKILAAGSRGGYVQLWNGRSGRPGPEFRGIDTITVLAWSADSGTLAAGDSQGSLYLRRVDPSAAGLEEGGNSWAQGVRRAGVLMERLSTQGIRERLMMNGNRPALLLGRMDGYEAKFPEVLRVWVQEGLKIPSAWNEIPGVQIKQLPADLEEAREVVRSGGVRRGDMAVLSGQVVSGENFDSWVGMVKGRNLRGLLVPPGVDIARLTPSDLSILLNVFDNLDESEHLLTFRPADAADGDLELNL